MISIVHRSLYSNFLDAMGPQQKFEVRCIFLNINKYKEKLLL